MVYYLGKGLQSPDISMLFKNLDSALLMFLSIIGAHQAFAENRVLVYGDLGQTMEVNRVVSIVNSYLLPGIVLKHVMKRVPKMSMDQYLLKIRISLALVPAIIKHLV